MLGKSPERLAFRKQEGEVEESQRIRPGGFHSDGGMQQTSGAASCGPSAQDAMESRSPAGGRELPGQAAA
jgi:hypothetical protein